MIYIINKVMIFFVIITAMFLCVGGTPAVAGNYYTDNTASSSGDGTISVPIKALAYAIRINGELIQ